MRNRFFILSFLLILTMLLAACGEANNNNNNESGVGTIVPTAGTSVPGATGLPESTLQATPVLSTPTEAVPAGNATAEATSPATAEVTPAATSMTNATASPTMAAETPSASQSTTPVANEPGGATGLIGIPQTGDAGVIGLASMFDFRLMDQQGNQLGTIQDYIVNTCEAHILYMVVQPTANQDVNSNNGSTANSGKLVLVPYQAVLSSPNSGSVNVQEKTFVIKANASDVAGAPAVDLNTIDMQNPSWDSTAQAYWNPKFQLALTAGCNVPVNNNNNTQAVTPQASSTPAINQTPAAGQTPTSAVQSGNNTNRQTIYKVALASKLLQASLQEGNGTLLGFVRDIAIVSNTGRTQYIVVQPQDSQGNQMVALPPGAVNIEYNGGTSTPVLVLLVKTDVFRGAPPYDVAAGNNDQTWFDYWDLFVPMTMDQLP